MSQVDLSQLAIDRSAPSQVRGHTRLRLFTRFLLPGVLIFGFLALITWAARDFIFPPRQVTVMPVIVTQASIISMLPGYYELKSDGRSILPVAINRLLH